MPEATASGAHSKTKGAARSHDHNQGNQDRKYTTEQKAEVIRVRKCSPTAFYDILGLEKVKRTVTDTEIKKAYRKISLLTHPDKNGYEHADEAFKMVSRAFGVLGDDDKKAKYDQFGGDPDRPSGRQQASSTFSRFPGAGEWQQEISPEEMFRRFFRGGLMGGLQGFDNGTEFVFNMRGGPDIRINQFGRATPRRRPRDTNAQERPAVTLQQTLINLVVVLAVLLPFLTSIFNSFSSSASLPAMRFDRPTPPHTVHRNTHHLKLDYYINPLDVQSYTSSQLQSLDRKVEINYINGLKAECQREQLYQQELRNQAQGWISTDKEKLLQASNLPMYACRELEELENRRNNK